MFFIILFCSSSLLFAQSVGATDAINFDEKVNTNEASTKYSTEYSSILPELSVKCYPNPAAEYVMINSYEEIRSIEVINFAGEKIFQTNVENSSYELRLNQFEYKPGIHWIKISSVSQNRLVKVMLEKW